MRERELLDIAIGLFVIFFLPVKAILILVSHEIKNKKGQKGSTCVQVQYIQFDYYERLYVDHQFK